MNAIRSVFSAFANLANAVNGLAGVIDAATGRLQQHIADGSEPVVLEHRDAEVQPSETVAPKRNGRAKANA